jgi:hypothetical protein
MSSEERGLVVHAGPVTVDVPRSVGYFGGVALAVSAGLIDPPLGLFIAAVPVLKMLSNSQAPRVVRFAGLIFDGAAQPVGGDAEGTVRLDDRKQADQEAVETAQQTRRGQQLEASQG